MRNVPLCHGCCAMGRSAPQRSTDHNDHSDHSAAAIVPPPFDGTPTGSPGMLYGAGGAPDGYTVVGAASSIDFSASVGSGWFELWGTPGASRTSGSWFAVSVQPHTGLGLERNAERVQIGHVIGMRSTSTDGVRTVRFPVGDTTITINSWGWANDALMNLAATLSLQGGRPVFGDTNNDTVMPFVVAPIPGMVTSGPNTFFLVAGRAVSFASIPGRDNPTIGRWTENGVTVD